MPSLPNLEGLKETYTPSARLYNWNAIEKALSICGIKLGNDEKSLIVAGDPQILLDLLTQIKSAFSALAPSGAEQEADAELAKQKKSQQQFQPTGKRGKGKPQPSIFL